MSFADLFKGKSKKENVPDISSFLPEEIYQSGVLELQDIIAPPALKVTPKEIHLGDKVARTLFVLSYPRFLNDGWFSPIINLDRTNPDRNVYRIRNRFNDRDP